MNEGLANDIPTPSTDPINQTANGWLYRDALGKLHEIASQEARRPPAAAQAAKVQALAADLGVDPEALAERIPEDTLRRLKFPMIEQPQPDGTTAFKHDLGIVEGRISSFGVDRAHAAIPPGSAPQPRDHGKFTK